MVCFRWLAVVSCFALVYSTGFAQEKRTDRPPGKMEDVLSQKALAKLKEQARAIDLGGQPAAGTGVKDLDDLLKVLDDLGYEPKIEEYMGYKYVRIPSNGITVSLSDDASLVFINSWCPKFEDLKAVTQDRLLNILELNGGFAYMFYSSKFQQLCCSSTIEAKMVAKAALRKRIDAVASLYSETRPFWNIPK